MKVTNKFTKGCSTFSCGSCGRLTRQTGRNDNEHLGLCAECYDLGGVENEICDSGSTPELEAEAAELRNIIVSKGGVLS